MILINVYKTSLDHTDKCQRSIVCYLYICYLRAPGCSIQVCTSQNMQMFGVMGLYLHCPIFRQRKQDCVNMLMPLSNCFEQTTYQMWFECGFNFQSCEQQDFIDRVHAPISVHHLIWIPMEIEVHYSHLSVKGASFIFSFDYIDRRSFFSSQCDFTSDYSV